MLLQIRLLLARCTLSFVFVVKTRAVIHYSVDSTIVVCTIQILFNPTMLDILCSQSSVVLNSSPKHQSEIYSKNWNLVHVHLAHG